MRARTRDRLPPHPTHRLGSLCSSCATAANCIAPANIQQASGLPGGADNARNPRWSEVGGFQMSAPEQTPEEIAEERIREALASGAGNLDLSSLGLRVLPESIGQLGSLQELHLGNNQLSALPESIGQLGSLQELYLLNNQLNALPESIGQLGSLQELHLSNNQLNALPESIGQLGSLQQLSLTDNRLSAVPEALLGLDKIEKLFLHGNEALGLPPEI